MNSQTAQLDICTEPWSYAVRLKELLLLACQICLQDEAEVLHQKMPVQMQQRFQNVQT